MTLERKSPWPIYSVRILARLLGLDEAELRSIATSAGRFYDPFDQVQPSKNKVRHIDNPTGRLKALQRTIYKRFLTKVPLPDGMVGGRRRKSIKHNAEPHVGRPTLVTIDLRDCFPHVSNLRVFDVWKKDLGASREVADILTKLTTFQRRLPQGASTSLTLANLSLVPLFEDVQKIADTLGLACTFYVDDISVSGKRAREAIEPIICAIRAHGHAVRQRKVAVMSSHGPQQVTGLGVNRILGAGAQRLRRLRQTIYALSIKGTMTAWQRRSLDGAIAQVRSINAVQGDALQRYADRCLPPESPGGRPEKLVERRPCRCSRRHRYQRKSVAGRGRGEGG